MKGRSMMKLSSFLLCATFTLTAANLTAQPGPKAQAGPATVNLGAAAPFAVLGGTGVTNAGGATTITGDLGEYPGTSFTGFPPGVVIGTTDIGNTAALQAQASLGTAITYALGVKCPAGQKIPCVLPSAELGGLTFTPGVYIYAGVATVSGPVYLKGNGVYIFQFAGGLTVKPGGTVVLTDNATAADVFWVTKQATLGSTDVFYGNILSTTSVTFTATGSTSPVTTLYGRALAETVVSFAATDDVILPVSTSTNGNGNGKGKK
jgi:hypothetical protein